LVQVKVKANTLEALATAYQPACTASFSVNCTTGNAAC